MLILVKMDDNEKDIINLNHNFDKIVISKISNFDKSDIITPKTNVEQLQKETTNSDNMNKSTNKNITRCNKDECNKKLGLLPFVCKCGLNFCGVHRYSDKHDCKFNYQEEYKKQLEKNNQKIVSDKIKKI